MKKDFDKLQLRSSTWKSWHKKGISLDKAISKRDQSEQVKLITKMATIKIKKRYSILEIGPGDGGVCEKLLKKYNKNITSYTLVDDIFMLNFCKKRLKRYKQVKYVSIENIDTIKGEKFKLLISNHCLAETTYDYRNYIYNTFFKNSREIFILDDITEGKQFNNSKGYFTGLILSLTKYFNIITITGGHKYSRKNQEAIYATK